MALSCRPSGRFLRDFQQSDHKANEQSWSLSCRLHVTLYGRMYNKAGSLDLKVCRWPEGYALLPAHEHLEERIKDPVERELHFEVNSHILLLYANLNITVLLMGPSLGSFMPC